jgi:hypothetical protein
MVSNHKALADLNEHDNVLRQPEHHDEFLQGWAFKRWGSEEIIEDLRWKQANDYNRRWDALA